MNLLSYLSGDVCLTEAALTRIQSLRVDSTAVAAFSSAENPGAPKSRRVKSIAVVPVTGILEPKQTLLGWLMGGTATQSVGRMVTAAIQDDDVKQILMPFDTPGGSSALIEEVGDIIRNGRTIKPIIGVASPEANSGGYWLMSQCSRCYITQSGIGGSVGAYRLHVDETAALEKEGYKVTVIRAEESPAKIAANPWEPLTSEALQGEQTAANATMSRFFSAIAAGRGVDIATVKANFGKGRVMNATDAVRAGLFDRVASEEQVLDLMLSGRIHLSSKTGRVEERGPRGILREAVTATATRFRRTLSS